MSRRSAAEIAGSVMDLTCTLTLLAMSLSQGAANLAGAVVGYLTLLAIRLTSGAPSSAQLVWGAWIAFFALALRGGVIGSALGSGATGWLAVLAGIVAGWASIFLSQAWLNTQHADPAHASKPWWSYSAPAILVAAVLLRIVYLNILPLLPEEAYYWNYAAHLDIGYLDHPPLVAWLIALGEVLVGRTEAGLRLGAFLCGLLTAGFVHGFARRLVDQRSAMMAAALAAALPFFFGAGVIMTPDALLIAAWSAAVYFFHGALVTGKRKSWFAAGIAMGLGLLSKYTIALLGLAVLVFVLLDRPSRSWLTHWEPYVSAAIALALFAPVIVWNHEHNWASFAFQASDRFGVESSFSLHVLLMNVLVVATPLPLIALPLLFAKRWTRESQTTTEPEHATPRNRLFVTCVVFTPLLVFVWSAFNHEPRLNWTAPIWLATLPLVGWTIMRADDLISWRCAGMYHLARKLPAALLMLNAALLYYVALGIPGLPHPKSFARAEGWATATAHLQAAHDRLARSTGSAPIIIGMDKYFTAAQLSYHVSRLLANPMRVTTGGVVFGGDGLMFEYWDTPQQFAGRTFIMVSRRKVALESESLAQLFQALDAETHPLPMIHDGPGGNRKVIDCYYYRIGYGYRGTKARHAPALRRSFLDRPGSPAIASHASSQFHGK